MLFRNFLVESGYGIAHLEDLPVEEMLRLLKNLSSLRAVQKLDGANLHVGVDLEGKLYTSREQKGGDRFYDSGDFPKRSAYDGFKSASMALYAVGDTIKRILSRGQELSVEVLFGVQPNTVIYGKDGFSYIAFLEPVDGDDPTKPIGQEDINELIKLLKHKTVNINSLKHDTTDGKTMVKAPTVTSWKFTGSDAVPSDKLKSKELTKAIKEVESYLEKRNVQAHADGEKLTNYEMLVSKKTSWADEREKVRQKLVKLVLPIKAELLDVSKEMEPSLRDPHDANQTAYKGIEGLIFTDPKTRESFKVVDQDAFSAVNKFNYSVRNRLVGKILTSDADAPLESRGGLVGVAKIRAINMFGMKGAEAPTTARKVLEVFARQGEKDGMASLEKSFNALSFESIKRKCGAIFTHTLAELDDELDEFKLHPPTVKIDGVKLEFTPEVKRRTLLTFAETSAEVERILKRIRAADSLADLFVTLVGKGALGWD